MMQFVYGSNTLDSKWNAMQCNVMEGNAIQCNSMQCNAMQCNAMQWRGNKSSLKIYEQNKTKL